MRETERDPEGRDIEGEKESKRMRESDKEKDKILFWNKIK